MSNLLYFLIALLATTIGAIAGLGGGVIIKPLFDMMAIDTPATISMYSAIAVFVMTVISLSKQIHSKNKFNIPLIFWISAGSFFGGFLGESLFQNITQQFSNNLIKITQTILLMIVLLLILLYSIYEKKLPKYKVKNKLVIFLLGLLLGTTSIFLGIGGGPLNIAIFSIFFSFSMKKSVIYSLSTIFFSQISKFVQVFFSKPTLDLHISTLLFICIAAILGGLIGSKIYQKQNEHFIKKTYLLTLISLIVICIINMIKIYFIY